MKRATLSLWLWIALAGLVLLPWYAQQDGLFSFGWLSQLLSSDPASASALKLLFQLNAGWFAPLLLALAGIGYATYRMSGVRQARVVFALGAFGAIFALLQGWVFGYGDAEAAQAVTGALDRQMGFGAGALLTLAAFVMLTATGISGMGKGQGDAFVVGGIIAIAALVGIFVFFPVGHILARSLFDNTGQFDLINLFNRLFSAKIWSMNCFIGAGNCGPAINSFMLGLATATGTTLLGLSFALIATRTDFRAKKLLRILTVLPIITPPFVIGLALILILGRQGFVSEFLNDWFDIPKSRWAYGFFGVWLAQMLSFTPIAFLVIIGVVEGVSPSLEEASQTLRANRWETFRRVSFPLMRPGLANAFLIGFIESVADFGNPLVLGSGYNVLSTEIFFAIVGAQEDANGAAVLALVLLSLTLTAFVAQRAWLGKKNYTSVTGKADNGAHTPMNPALSALCYCTAIPWAIFTAIVYGMIMFGGFVKLWGINHSFTLDHYLNAFAIEWTSTGLWFSGAAWDSYFTTLRISAMAAPLTAIVGLLTAYLLVRQRFFGRDLFEFGTMLSFAIPGTVIGVSYIMAFNVPPIELTGTGAILIICFMFRNMPVGVRGGMAALTQLDKSLDEASITLGANSATTVRRVIIPLIGPAILAAVTYSFVRAITSVSAVIFLVSAEHNMATAYIIGLVENGDFGVAIAYCTVLIVTMLAAILGLQAIIGTTKLRRQNRLAKARKATA